MRLEGSCHCGAVRFTLQSRHPYPFNLCYCSICRKTAGGGGYAINLGGDHATLEVVGREHVRVYHARMRGEGGNVDESPAERHFCGICASCLWLWDPRWPELAHPFASAIDTPLPVPPERTHLMLASKAPWVEPAIGPHDRQFAGYPDESISDWHERLGLADHGERQGQD
ncbi:MAG TPA: GFA family protein [Geminicoccaceae bacterium]|nr:GFA family protein [Geminicoccaceae bacterium]